MNSNKKTTPARGVPQPINRSTGMPAQQSGKRPVAPPIYQPKQSPKTVQTKAVTRLAPPNLRGAVQQTAPGVLQTKSPHHPVAPPVYRPEAKKIVQPKPISHQAKIANSIQPSTAKRTMILSRAVQLADEESRNAHECSAKVVSNGGQEYPGEYDGQHAEINALESYFASGGDAAGITRIELSSSPCKYCHIILSDLGILHKVVCTDRRKYGRCQGGSYGWFNRGGSLWKVIKAKTGAEDEDSYAKSVSARQSKLM